MEHPGLNITKIKKDLTLEEVQVKVSELNSRLTFAYNTGNQSLIHQISMALETYTRAQHEMLDEMFSNDNGDDLSDKIDIS